jgi:hypothetical protein
MGEAKSRFRRMQNVQPWCVYCGGSTPGTSIDHMPPMAVFDLKHRLKGMEYMACDKCHGGTRRLDQVAALYARLYSTTPSTQQTRDETAAVFKAVGNNIPEVLYEVRREYETTDVIARARRVLPDAQATLSAGPIAHKHILAFGARAALALHFELTNEILPPAGGVFVRWMSNYSIVQNNIPNDFIEMLGEPKTLKQGSRNLANQFEYASRATDTGKFSAHFATFRTSFAIQAFVARDAADMAEAGVSGSSVFRPGFLKALNAT